MVEKNNKLGFVVAGLLLGILMASMDNTIVVTAMGTIVGDLGGLRKLCMGRFCLYGRRNGRHADFR